MIAEKEWTGWQIKKPIKFLINSEDIVWAKILSSTAKEQELLDFWFIEDKQEDWIEKICYELEPDLNIWYDYLIDQEKLLSRNETANISRDRIRQAILKHLPK